MKLWGVVTAAETGGIGMGKMGPRGLCHFSLAQLDVFTSRAWEGNSTCRDYRRGLTDSEMQALAREMNISETTFIFPRDVEAERQCGIKVRIFTPHEGLPFAGHPTLGTAMVLRKRSGGRMGAGASKEKGSGISKIELDLRVGKIPVEFRIEAEGQVFGEMQQLDPEFGDVHLLEAVARVANLKPDDTARGVPIETVSTGVPFTIVPLKSVPAVRSPQVEWRNICEYLERDFRFTSSQGRRKTLRRGCTRG